MFTFQYLAVDFNGQYIKGRMQAPSLRFAERQLKDQGLWIIRLTLQKGNFLHKEIKFGGPRVKHDHFIVFCRQLAAMYQAGIGTVDAIQMISVQTESKALREILLDIAKEMRNGIPFSNALQKYPTVFPTIFVSMIHAGEVSGNLDEMLNRLAIFYEKEHYTREKVKSAMVYPAVMSVVTLVVVVILLTFVVPRFVSSFEGMGLQLPLPTRIVIATSHWVVSNWYVLLGLAFVPAIGLRLAKKSAKWTYYIDYLKLKVPVFGQLWHKQAISRFCRTFCSLYVAAIPMMQVMTLVASVSGNEVISKSIRESREAIGNGQSLADPFVKNGWFPPMVTHMLTVGEQVGLLDRMLEKVAEFYEADVDAMADRLKVLLEPIMIVILAGIVGLIVLAIMMPTFTMIGNM